MTRLSVSPPSRDAAKKRSRSTQQILEAATEVAVWQLNRRRGETTMHSFNDTGWLPLGQRAFQRGTFRRGHGIWF